MLKKTNKKPGRKPTGEVRDLYLKYLKLSPTGKTQKEKAEILNVNPKMVKRFEEIKSNLEKITKINRQIDLINCKMQDEETTAICLLPLIEKIEQLEANRDLLMKKAKF